MVTRSGGTASTSGATRAAEAVATSTLVGIAPQQLLELGHD